MASSRTARDPYLDGHKTRKAAALHAAVTLNLPGADLLPERVRFVRGATGWFWYEFVEDGDCVIAYDFGRHRPGCYAEGVVAYHQPGEDGVMRYGIMTATVVFRGLPDHPELAHKLIHTVANGTPTGDGGVTNYVSVLATRAQLAARNAK